ncbi:class I SAM-dependent methyltransferase [Pseudomonas guariconensis]|uniref:class I SAM-dependent methyltransferase n=1 Tax=Pseudomonas guariconensis TaxID=1288410 RepID=UPI0018D9A17F|nr:class I SAM-dependent methyltransferase [Pseudomonas guariconensis]MBH3359490.1 class I SAM-dependent methyltransferase [Pseudomonas guariconensis]
MSSTFNPADRQAYWDSFYSRQDASVPSLPSQFAVFSASDFVGVDSVIEFGCGNGRDSEFLALSDFQVLALDASSEAIELCRQRTKSANARYEWRSVEQSAEVVRAFLEGKRRVAVYARFFLHAIDTAMEDIFLKLLATSLPAGSLLYFEYRTKEDEQREKRFGQHYRRYIDHDGLIGKLQALGFAVIYQVQGRGFAKYRDEDALVGRCVAVKE